MSPSDICKTFSKSDDVVIDAPIGTRIEFTSVTYKGRDFTSEAQNLLLLRKNELHMRAGSVESALCGRLIIDSTAGDFLFMYKLHSTPSEQISCLLSEEFYIPPSRSYEMPRQIQTPQSSNNTSSTYLTSEDHINNNGNQMMMWSQNPLSRDRGPESGRQPTISSAVAQPVPTYLFNSANANKAALESIFQKDQFVSKF